MGGRSKRCHGVRAGCDTIKRVANIEGANGRKFGKVIGIANVTR